MKTYIVSLTLTSFLLSSGPAIAGSWIDSYWPLNDGDTKTFVYSGSSQLTMNTADNGAGEYEISDDSPAGSAAEFYQNTGTGITLDHASVNSGWVKVYFNPPVLLMTDNMLQNGGSASTSTTVSQQGVNYPATYTIAISLAGTVVEPAGMFANCRNITVTEKATVPGQGNVTVNAMTAVLAPGVGIIRKLVSQGVWADLVSGTVGGIDVGILASGPPVAAIKTPANGQRIATADDNLAITGSVSGYAPGMQVFYQFNSGPWVNALVVGTNWSGSMTAQPGTNTINAYALDSMGRSSPTVSVAIQFVVTSPMTININGFGSVVPNDNGSNLVIGQSYTLTATPAAGYMLTNWLVTLDGLTVLSTNRAASFLMQSNLVLTVTFVDVQKPVLTITTPTANQRWSNAVFTVAGKVTDNEPGGMVWYRLNGGDLNTASGWSNWTAGVTLIPGTNTVAAYAVDAAGNRSVTNSQKVVYVVSAPISLIVVGNGTLSGASDGQMFELGKSVTLTAKVVTGCILTNWLVTVDNATVLSTNKAVPFLMQSNLVLTATFVDVTKPVVTILSPTVSTSRLTNGLVTVQVRATDNGGVSNVEFYLNGQDFGPGASQMGTNIWTRNFALAVGTNDMGVAANDSAGNVSATNSVQLVYVNQQTNANAITLSEDLLMTIYPGPPSFNNDIVQDTGMLNAALKVPGLQLMSANIWSNLNLSLSFGYFSFAGSLSDADALTTNMAVFNFADTNDPSGNTACVEQLTVKRAGNTLMVNVRAGNASNLTRPISLIAGSYYPIFPYPMEPVFSETPTFALMLQDGDSLETYEATTNAVYVTPKYQGGLLQVTGRADFTPPTISITTPVSGQRSSNAVFTVKGAARDNIQVSNVWFQINGTGWEAATTTNKWTNWTASVTLMLGTNTLNAYAVDASGNPSTTNSVNVVSSTAFKLQLALASIARLNANGLTFSLELSTGLNGLIQVSTNLVNWNTLTNFVGTNSTLTFRDPAAVNSSRRFYRAVIP